MSVAFTIEPDWSTTPEHPHYALTDAPLLRTLRTHRRCAPEHRQIVLRDCLRDSSLIPRWHQDDRGEADAHRGVHVLAPPGAYSNIPVWNSREHWLEVVVPAVLAQHDHLRRDRGRYGFGVERFMQWARVKAALADRRTGRQCIVTPGSLAHTLGVDERTVQKMNAFAREVGLEVVVMDGRMLNEAEKRHCQSFGSRQRGLASEVALTQPRRFYPQPAAETPVCGTPTSGRTVSRKYTVRTSTLRGLTAKKKGPAPPALRKQKRRRPHPALEVAQGLARRLSWLSGEQPGRLAPALARFVAAGWTVDDVVNALDDLNTRRQVAAPTAATIRTRPAAVLAAMLRQLDPDTDIPGDLFTADAPPWMPCGHADCDGRGWRSTWDRDGREAVYRCPDCGPHGGRATEARHSPADPPF